MWEAGNVSSCFINQSINLTAVWEKSLFSKYQIQRVTTFNRKQTRMQQVFSHVTSTHDFWHISATQQFICWFLWESYRNQLWCNKWAVCVLRSSVLNARGFPQAETTFSGIGHGFIIHSAETANAHIYQKQTTGVSHWDSFMCLCFVVIVRKTR